MVTIGLKGVVTYLRGDIPTQAVLLKKLLLAGQTGQEDLTIYLANIKYINRTLLEELFVNGFMDEMDRLDDEAYTIWLQAMDIYELMTISIVGKYPRLIQAINQYAQVFAREAVQYDRYKQHKRLHLTTHDELLLPIVDYLINYALKTEVLGYKSIDTQSTFSEEFYQIYLAHMIQDRVGSYHQVRLYTVQSLETVYQRYPVHVKTLRDIQNYINKT